MRSMLTALAAAVALAFVAGPATAQADCYKDVMTDTRKMISQAEAKGADARMIQDARALSAEGEKLLQAGKKNEALVKFVKSQEMVAERGGR